MSAPDSSDVTLALVDANVLACWESKVKLGFECSLLLKHSEGKITTTLQFVKNCAIQLFKGQEDSIILSKNFE